VDGAPVSQACGHCRKLGKRGRMEQCRVCKTVYPDEADGTALWWAGRMGIASVNGPGRSEGRLALFVGSDG